MSTFCLFFRNCGFGFGFGIQLDCREICRLGLALFCSRTNIDFGFFATLVSTELALCLSQFCPRITQGSLSFSKQAFRLGHYRPRFSNRWLGRPGAGKTGALSKI